MANSKLSLQNSMLLIKEKLIRYNNINYPAKVIEEPILETLRKDNYLFNLSTLPFIFSKLHFLTGDPLFSFNLVSPIIETLLRVEKIDLTTFPSEKKSCDGAICQNCLQSIVYLSSNLVLKLCALSSDLFLYSLSGDSEKIQEIKKEVSDIDKDCWKALKQKVVFPAQNMFKNIDKYDTGLKDFEVKPVTVHNNHRLYYENRKISILSQIDKIKFKVTKITEFCDTRDLASFDPSDPKVKDDISDYPNISIEQVALILSPLDYRDFQEFIDPFGECTYFFKRFFSDWQSQGMSIYKHKSVKPGNFIILEKGTFLLINFLSLLQQGKPFPKMDFYEDITIPSVFFGIGCYCIREHVCPPMHYREESYAQIKFPALRKPKQYFLNILNDPESRNSFLKTLNSSLKICVNIKKLVEGSYE